MDNWTKVNNEYNKCAQQIKEVYNKLDSLYNKEEILIKDIKLIQIQFRQLQEDKEALQMLYMHHSNKLERLKELIKSIKE